MLCFEEARQIILDTAQPLGSVRRKLSGLLGYALAEPLVASFDSPRFDYSAMDGFGVRMVDMSCVAPDNPVSLVCEETVAAGDTTTLTLKDGQTVRIFTGAAIPKGVEAVVMREDCTETEDGRILVHDPDMRAGENIRRRGEEFRKGQEILPAGTVINAAVVGLLSSFGMTSARVTRQPRIAFVITGSELVSPGKPLKPGQIYDTNSYTLAAACEHLGFSQVQTLWAPDNPMVLRRVLKQALADFDVIIPVGGVSVGDYDYVKAILSELGVKNRFWKISMKPGKPVYFGTYKPASARRVKLVVGLPGNPVSAMVTFHTLVKPALLKQSGRQAPYFFSLPATLTQPLRKKPGRLELVRGIASVDSADGLMVSPTLGQDSHMLGGLAKANCLITFPQDADLLHAGETVRIEWLPWM